METEAIMVLRATSMELRAWAERADCPYDMAREMTERARTIERLIEQLKAKF